MATVKLLKNTAKNRDIFEKFGFAVGENEKNNGVDKVSVIAEFTSEEHNKKLVQFCEIEEVKHEEVVQKDGRGQDRKVMDKRMKQQMPNEEFCMNYLQKMADDWEVSLTKVVIPPNLF